MPEEKEVWEWSWLQVPDGPDSVDYAWFGDPSGAGVDVTAKLKQKLDESTARSDGYNLGILACPDSMVLYNGVPLACPSLRSNPIQLVLRAPGLGPPGPGLVLHRKDFVLLKKLEYI